VIALPDFTTPQDWIPDEHGSVAYWKFGDGPDVVLVHGWPLHSATFRRLVPLLACHFTLHLFDQPGAGHTKWSGPIGLAENSAALRRGIDHIGLERYAFVAHDSGACIARLVAAGDSRVRALVIGNTEIPGHHPGLLVAMVLLSRVPGGGHLLTRSMRFSAIRRSVFGFGSCFRDPAFVDGDFRELFVEPLLAPSDARAGHLAMLRSLDFALIDDLARVHGRIHAPVLCIWGPDDPYFPIAKARRMLAEFAGPAELVDIPGAKLYAHEDHPETFAAHATTFLTRVS
jgi:pimeloyl-ACP methyl ester carboxylesterase